jgi:hypothetical protein
MENKCRNAIKKSVYEILAKLESWDEDEYGELHDAFWRKLMFSEI